MHVVHHETGGDNSPHDDIKNHEKLFINAEWILWDKPKLL